MKRNNVAGLKEFILALCSLNAGSLNSLSRTESIIGNNLHTKALGYASNVTTYITKSKNTQLLAHQFSTTGSIEKVTNTINQKTEHQLSNTVGILTRSIHCYDVVSSSSRQVNIVISGTGTNNNLQVLCCVQYLSVNLI